MELEKKTNLEDFLGEVEIGKDESINNLFNVALRQAFTQEFVNKIEQTIRRRIRIKEIYGKNPNVIAYNRGNAIYIEKNNFNKLPVKKRIQFLLHEFIHILQRKKKVGILKSFKDINNLTNDLIKIVNKNLTKPYSVFLTSRNMKLGPGKKYEIMGYLMNNSIDWSGLTDEGKRDFVNTIKRSNIINVNHPFWKKRLP